MSNYICPLKYRVFTSVYVHNNAKNNGPINLKLENIVVCRNFSTFTTMQTVMSHSSALAHCRKFC